MFCARQHHKWKKKKNKSKPSNLRRLANKSSIWLTSTAPRRNTQHTRTDITVDRITIALLRNPIHFALRHSHSPNHIYFIRLRFSFFSSSCSHGWCPKSSAGNLHIFCEMMGVGGWWHQRNACGGVRSTAAANDLKRNSFIFMSMRQHSLKVNRLRHHGIDCHTTFMKI